MEYWLDKIKVTIQTVIVFLLAFITPMKNAIDVLLIVAIAFQFTLPRGERLTDRISGT